VKRTPIHARGVTIVEVLALVACLVVLTAMGLPAFQRLGCSAARDISRANLATLSQAHVMYATDWSGRQYTLVPDTLGANSGLFNVWQSANGCVPQALLGVDSQGVPHRLGTQCQGADVRLKEKWLKPIDFAGRTTAGSFRLSNVRAVNEYVNGRFYDQTFYAPDDQAMTRKIQRWINEERDFERDAESGILNTTYDYSPAAMYHPRVFGDGTSASAPSFQSPNFVANGEGYKSPSNSQCQYPALKTRLLERHCMEPFLGPNPAYAGGRTPYRWNQSFQSRSQALFFDGSVRLFTTAEAMDSEARSRVPGSTTIRAPLWMRTTPFGSLGFGGAQADDFIVNTSVHYLTVAGIRGRDTLSPP